MSIQINEAEAALLLELLNRVDQMVQYADVQPEISNLIQLIQGE